MNDLITFVILPVVALLVGIGAVGGIAAATGLTVYWKRHAFSALLTLTSIASVGAIVLSGRRLQLGVEGLENIGQADAASGIAGKLLLVGVIATAIALCAARLFDFNRRIVSNSRFHRRGLAHPVDITIAFMCFYVAYSILPIFFSPDHFFHVRLIYPFFIYLAIFLWLPLHESDPLQTCKIITGLLVMSSLVAAIVIPQSAIQPGYSGLIPGFNIRLWGTTSHANSLGAVTCGYMLFEMAGPVRRRWLHVLLMGLASVALVLSQSKTSIVSVMTGAIIIYGVRAWHFFNKKGRAYDGRGGHLLAVLMGVSCIALVVFAAVMMFGDGNILKSIEHKLNPQAVSTLSSGTGRLEIWAAAIDAGMQNPLFGQGNDFWNAETRRRLGLSGAASAHNLYLQAFSLSGLVGLTALLVFVGYLIRYAIRGASASGGATVAMLAVFLLRSLTETPIAPNAVLAAEFFSMTGFIIYIIDRGARARPVTSNVPNDGAISKNAQPARELMRS